MYNKKLTIVVVTLKYEVLLVFLSSIKNIITKEIELIIVNQTFTNIDDKISKLLKLEYKIINTQTLMSASHARNFGAKYAIGKYIYFSDDDSKIFNINNSMVGLFLEFLSTNKCDVCFFDRGVEKDGIFYAQSRRMENLTYRNFSKLVIEWNVIMRTSLFHQSCGFFDIGTGSSHAAQSGEMFELFSKVLNKKICKYPDIKIVHPTIRLSLNHEKSLFYEYGASYAVGISIKNMSHLSHKLYWIFRGIASSFKYISCHTTYNYSWIKLKAFFRGVCNFPPNSKSDLR